MSTVSANVIELTSQNFVPLLDDHPLAVVAFWAPTSEPCLAFSPVLAATAARNPDALVARVDVQSQQAISAQFNVQSVPTLMVLRDNMIVYVNAGALQPGELDEVLAGARALDMEQVRRKIADVGAATLSVSPAQTPAAAEPHAGDAGLLSIEAHLRASLRGPGSALAEAGRRLAAGSLVAIPNAFEPAFAERMHRCLDRCTDWRVYEGYEEQFHFHHHNLYDTHEFPPDLAWCAQVFGSAGTKEWVSRLSGRPCDGPTEVSASWYLPGDHSLPHNDIAATDAHFSRQVAFVWHLAKDWQPQWGGALYWCSQGLYLPPVFNTLWLFNVGPESNHFVTHVSPYAQGKRLAINGWWTGPGATGNRVPKGPARIATGDAGGADILIY